MGNVTEAQAGDAGTPGPATDPQALLLDSVTDYAIFMIRPDGTVATWNRGAEVLKGYAATEIIGQHFSCFYTDADVAAGKPDRELQDAADKGMVRDEGWRVRKDGSTFWANVLITAMHDDAGTLLGFSKVTRDETERQATEQHVRRLELVVDRERIASSMHDSIVHRIFDAGLKLQGAVRLADDPLLRCQLEGVIADLDATLREIRSTILDLKEHEVVP